MANNTEEYLEYLKGYLLKFESRFEALKTKEEFIRREISKEDKEAEFSLEETLTTTEKIQYPTDGCYYRNFIEILPKNICIRKSDMFENEYGIWSSAKIPKAFRFGPCKGIISYDQDETCRGDHFLQMLNDEQIEYHTDDKDDETDKKSNWLSYINFASHAEQQNLKILYCDGQIYYQTIKDVMPNTEMLVWYGWESANETEDKDKGSKSSQSCDSSEHADCKVTHAREETRNSSLSSFCVKEFDQIIQMPNMDNEQSIDKNENLQILSEGGNKNVMNKTVLSTGSIANSYISELNNNLQEHVDAEEKPNQCDICGKYLATSSSLKEHKHTHTGEKRYHCDVCGKGFVQSSNLKAHKHIHTGEKPFHCQVCGKNFVTNSSLKKHKLIHTGEKPYVCDVCGKSFATNSNFKEHKRIHTGAKPYYCGICRKSFAKSRTIKEHKHIHAGEKPYHCHICGKSFTRNGCLKEHRRVHTGEKPYTCDICGRCFSTNNGLKGHKRIHTGEKPYGCGICEKTFTVISTLRRHERRMHRGTKSHLCRVCGKTFIENSYHKTHECIYTEDRYLLF